MKTKLTILISLLSFACIGQSGSIKLSKINPIGNLEYQFNKDSLPNYGLRFDGTTPTMPFFFNNTPVMVRIKGDTVVIESPQLKFIQIDGTTYEIIRKSELREVNKITKPWSNVYDTLSWFNPLQYQYIQKIKPKTK